MKTHKFFLSHYHGDKEIAETISTLLSKLSLQQISPWFSSDISNKGGITPGSIWFNDIIDKIENSKALIALITPNSIAKPWLYYESGMAQSLVDCDIIPVCIGMNKDDIYPPFAQYHIFQLSDYRSLMEFVEKVLSKFDVKFDEELSKNILELAVKRISSIKFKEILDNPRTNDILQNLKSHIDKRFIEIWERPNLQITDSSLKSKGNIKFYTSSKMESDLDFTVTFQTDLMNPLDKIYIEIKDSDTFSDITTRIYFLLSDFISAYSYLEEWVIKDLESGKLLIVREIGDRIPAKSLVNLNSKFKIELLKKPYSPTDSQERL